MSVLVESDGWVLVGTPDCCRTDCCSTSSWRTCLLALIFPRNASSFVALNKNLIVKEDRDALIFFSRDLKSSSASPSSRPSRSKMERVVASASSVACRSTRSRTSRSTSRTACSSCASSVTSSGAFLICWTYSMFLSVKWIKVMGKPIAPTASPTASIRTDRGRARM
ncbi:hypothetical protein K458DRAFT_192946 [Lentithecium fluviatile CBS 122367]|uniref:Uncharacterized protein n=1 Tax=Lentithecium fluviatile CBS 122367 TaxID=1168545 RepID=A0A6G1IDT6_9PLEO|nr:hypothetical protein K458DRAFT_192946 [Lentithecium fluviatile CBS 122367]